MPAGMKSSGEGINHFNGIRLRVLGDGLLEMKILSLPDEAGNQVEVDLVPLDMDNIRRGVEPFKKTNFMQQRAQYEIFTMDFGDYFKLNRIVIYMKKVFVNYPG